MSGKCIAQQHRATFAAIREQDALATFLVCSRPGAAAGIPDWRNLVQQSEKALSLHEVRPAGGRPSRLRQGTSKNTPHGRHSRESGN